MAVQQSSAVYWMHEDPVTKSKRVTDINGTVVSTVELDPWGADTSRSSSAAFQPHKYTTYEHDGNASDEAMFRRYNRWHSRFDQPDPYDGSYDETDPQSFNRYSYTQNDPVNFVDPDGLDPISSARNLLQNGSCRGLFGKTNPLTLLDNLIKRNHIRVSEKVPRISSFRGNRFVGFSDFRPFGKAGMETIDVTLHPPVSGPERNPYIFMSSAFLGDLKSKPQYGGEYTGLSSEEVGGVSLIHELLHAAGRIPHDSSSDAQSHLNNWLVKEFCVTIPNKPAFTTTPALQNSPTIRPQMGRGPLGRGYIGYPSWWSSMWNFVNWVNSIPVGGGYGEVIGYHINPPKKKE
jgi:RHS repeat-associated protein